MPYNRSYSDPIPYDDEGGGPTSRLVSQLIGIQDRKTQRARQAEMDRIAEEDRQRQIKQEDEDRALKFAEIQYKIAAEQNRPKEKLAPVQMPVWPPSTPQDMAAFDQTGFSPPEPDATESAQEVKLAAEQPIIEPEVASPIPTQRLTIGGQTLDREMPDRGETMARQAEDSRAAKLASGGVELTPEIIASMPEGPLRDVFQMFAGSIQQPPNLSAALAAQVRNESAGGVPPKTENIGGRLKGWNSTTKRFDVDFGQAGDPDKVAGEKGSWLTKTVDGKSERVWVTDEQKRTAPAGMFSDVRPTSTSIRKADPAKLKMARAALGGPDVPNSLWSLATQINNDPSMMGAFTGAVRSGAAQNFPRISSRKDPKARLYISQIKGFASSIAKAFGESGMLTDQDIQRAIGLFPIIGEDPSLSLEKLERVKAVMDAGMTSDDFRSVFGRDPSPAEGGGVGSGVDTSGTQPTLPPESASALDRLFGGPK